MSKISFHKTVFIYYYFYLNKGYKLLHKKRLKIIVAWKQNENLQTHRVFFCNGKIFSLIIFILTHLVCQESSEQVFKWKFDFCI